MVESSSNTRNKARRREIFLKVGKCSKEMLK